MNRFVKSALLALMVYPAQLYAQTEAFSLTMVMTPGDSLREAGDLPAAVDRYKKSIAPGHRFPPGDVSPEQSIYLADLYNLSRALSRLGQQDSAVQYLKRFQLESKDSVGEALSDPDFYQLRNAADWPQLETSLIRAYSAGNKQIIKDLAYAKALWYLRAADQAYYKDIEIAEAKTGKSSTVVLALWDLKKRLNLENQRSLEGLIKTRGWPKISQVGNGPAAAAFLVIQHADLRLQQKYLPAIRALCAIGEAHWANYALMYDRIQVELGKPQHYGSQVIYNPSAHRYELAPLEDASKVDIWRKEASLQPLSDYLKMWSITWPDSAGTSNEK